MLEIISNGSKWAGQQPDSIDVLVETLKQYTLDPTFEEYGNFVCHNPHWIKKESNEIYKGCTKIHGNFYTLSHVFDIITDDKEIIVQLETLIRNNQQTEAYKQAKIELEEREKRKQEELRTRYIKKGIATA